MCGVSDGLGARSALVSPLQFGERKAERWATERHSEFQQRRKVRPCWAAEPELLCFLQRRGRKLNEWGCLQTGSGNESHFGAKVEKLCPYPSPLFLFWEKVRWQISKSYLEQGIAELLGREHRIQPSRKGIRIAVGVPQFWQHGGPLPKLLLTRVCVQGGLRVRRQQQKGRCFPRE